MSNVCSFELVAYGTNKENLVKLANWLNAKYFYKMVNGEPVYTGTADRHFGKIIYFGSKVKKTRNGYTLKGKGTCLWSAAYCLLKNFMASVHEISTDPLDQLKAEHETNLLVASKELGIKVKVDAYEENEDYVETYVIDNGEFTKMEKRHSDEQYVTFDDLPKITENIVFDTEREVIDLA